MVVIGILILIDIQPHLARRLIDVDPSDVVRVTHDPLLLTGPGAFTDRPLENSIIIVGNCPHRIIAILCHVVGIPQIQG